MPHTVHYMQITWRKKFGKYIHTLPYSLPENDSNHQCQDSQQKWLVYHLLMYSMQVSVPTVKPKLRLNTFLTEHGTANW